TGSGTSRSAARQPGHGSALPARAIRTAAVPSPRRRRRGPGPTAVPAGHAGTAHGRARGVSVPRSSKGLRQPAQDLALDDVGSKRADVLVEDGAVGTDQEGLGGTGHAPV